MCHRGSPSISDRSQFSFWSGPRRIGVTVFFGVLVIAAFLLVVVSLNVWRDATVSARSRLPVLCAAFVTILIVISGALLLTVTWNNTDAGIAKMAAQLRDAGISVQTTLVVYDTFDRNQTATRVFGDSSFSFLMPQTQRLWRGIAERPPGGIEARLVPPRYADFTRSLVGALHRNGVQLLAGTDAMGIPMVVPGSSLLRELYLLSQSGLTPYEAIRTATVNPANFLGKEKEFGTIAVGKRADLLLLESNPLENLAALNQPLGVLVRGKWLPRERLHELLSALR